MRTTLAERTRQLLTDLEIDQVGLASIACVTKGAVNQWLTSKPTATMKARAAYSIADKKGYNPRWLILGEGPERTGLAYENAMSIESARAKPYLIEDDETTREITTIARSLDDIGKGMLLSKARDIADERKSSPKANTAS